MATFSCVLLPEAVSRLYGALICLAKFSDVVGIEITPKTLSLTALNASKTSSVFFNFNKDAFFRVFNFSSSEPPSSDGLQHFTCQMYNKALMAVFRSRSGESRDRESTVERCEMKIEDDPQSIECHLVVQLLCKSGIKKTYRLQYESADILRPLFDKESCRNNWTISAYSLKHFSEYFGAKTELLDIHNEGGRATFTSYTEKVMHGSEVLKQPLQTSIAIDTLDFDQFRVDESLHIGIGVKDFKAIVSHAATLSTAISAYYTNPGQPLRFWYKDDSGMSCDVTLMTIGQYRGSVTPASVVARTVSAQPSARPSIAPPSRPASREATTMPPPSKPAPCTSRPSQESVKPPTIAPEASVDEQSLFVNDAEYERQWDERNYEEEEEDQLGWNNSYSTNALRTSLVGKYSVRKETNDEGMLFGEEAEIPPTQPVAEAGGLFD